MRPRNQILIVLGVVFVIGLILRLGFNIGMTQADIHISAAAEPLWCLGGHTAGEFCSPETVLPITNSLVMTVLVDLLLLVLILVGARSMQLVPRGLQNSLEVVVEGFYNFALGIDRKNIAKFFALPATIFIFFLVANLLALVPGVGSIGVCRPHGAEGEHAQTSTLMLISNPLADTDPQEGDQPSAFAGLPGYCSGENLLVPYLRAPAADLNVTFAFALVAVFMIEFFGFQALGLGYLSRFFNVREGGMGFFVGIIELISEFTRPISFAFRIFGNIFGGEVILIVMSFLFGYLLPLPFYGFELFVAIVQAVIFAVLTLVFMSNAVIAHGSHDDHAAEAHA